MQTVLRLTTLIPVIDGSIALTEWPELSYQEAIVCKHQNIQLKLWIDNRCAMGGLQSSIEELRRTINPLIECIFVEVEFYQLDDTILNHIYEKSPIFVNQEEDRILNERFLELHTQAYDLILENFNRLIDYFRVEKGQFWLEKYVAQTHIVNGYNPREKLDFFLLDFNHNLPKASILSSNLEVKVFEWKPPYPDITVVFNSWPPEANPRGMTKQDWINAASYVVDKRIRLSPSKDFLSRAEALAFRGDTRSAITEAVAALETAIAKFSDKPSNSKLGERFGNRLDIQLLKNQIDNIGTRCTINQLFPLLFSETELPTSTLNACQKALQVRNNVAHQGQRDVQNIDFLIESIRELCELLDGYTVEENA